MNILCEIIQQITVSIELYCLLLIKTWSSCFCSFRTEIIYKRFEIYIYNQYIIISFAQKTQQSLSDWTSLSTRNYLLSNLFFNKYVWLRGPDQLLRDVKSFMVWLIMALPKFHYLYLSVIFGRTGKGTEVVKEYEVVESHNRSLSERSIEKKQQTYCYRQSQMICSL